MIHNYFLPTYHQPFLRPSHPPAKMYKSLPNPMIITALERTTVHRPLPSSQLQNPTPRPLPTFPTPTSNPPSKPQNSKTKSTQPKNMGIRNLFPWRGGIGETASGNPTYQGPRAGSQVGDAQRVRTGVCVTQATISRCADSTTIDENLATCRRKKPRDALSRFATRPTRFTERRAPA